MFEFLKKIKDKVLDKPSGENKTESNHEQHHSNPNLTDHLLSEDVESIEANTPSDTLTVPPEQTNESTIKENSNEINIPQALKTGEIQQKKQSTLVENLNELESPSIEIVDNFQGSIVIENETINRPKGWFGLTLTHLKDKISKTSETLINNIVSITTGKETLDDDLLDEIEEKLIKADIGFETAVNLVEKLRDNKNNIAPDKLKEYLKVEFSNILLGKSDDFNLKYFDNKLNIYLITGVNGVGKTTLIGKMAYRFKEQGKKVLIAAGDTFRAAAEEQLSIWSKRSGADIVRKDGADPASVIYDSILKAQKESYDVLLVDTAGRLHNKFNLMEELRKIRKTIDKNAENSLSESILVLDATTGQNGLQQAKIFSEAVSLSAVALTKLDGSAKGGIIIAIASEMNLPVKLVGVGEKIDDLRDFNPSLFIEALFE